MKRKVLILCAVLLAAAIAICFSYSPIRLRLYPGFRIQGTLCVNMDGKPFVLQKENIQSSDRFDVVPADDGTALLSFLGGDYGDYMFELLIDGPAQPITVHCFQHNWWNIQRFELQITVDTKQQTITYTGLCSDYGDDGVRIAEPIDKTQAFSDEGLQIQIG